ncbi:MAG: hypothetical protein ACOVRN_00895 [Flavobacterium sp.]
MDSFNNIYDIESPRTSQRKMATIEHSLHHSLLQSPADDSYRNYSCLLVTLIATIAIGIVASIILAILTGLKHVD